MRIKRHKDYKRYMNMYCQTFKFHKPYQVLVDADFIQAALDQRMDLRVMIPNVLCDASKQMVTPCTMAQLKSRGEEASGAFIASKRFEKRRCKHQDPVEESICISQIIADTNPHNYVVASQSKRLRVQLAQVPGVPLLYIHRSNLILEPPSEASLKTCKKIETDKTHAKSKELQTLKGLKVSALAKLLKKKMGPKEPNPLSIKKKKKKPEPTTTITSTTTSIKKRGAESEADAGVEKKKTRRRRKSKSTATADASATTNTTTPAGSESS
ncbi:Fcf1-domain-containing protein [Lobosporangium transversale]|uniref:U three protein 23 n=1 Tax=Lobosporangium transversale TaxID=64571 RepID=A0A1Y2GG73_9FUNG|nr:Fcf1-domain-containing protein [Lobosporangium transversale]ORZ06750.1 Fcf1-domain-containing protein [Lobosporangium transversale]|eukprot:XP_021877671.1 Fcf1-domain-containing protein [Lobosporangium transversale]